MKNDEELVKEYLAGDNERYDELVKRYIKIIYNYALRLSRSEADAQDIAQETFFRAWKNIKRFDRGKSFKNWILTIARNIAIDTFRKKRPILFSELTAHNNDISMEEEIVDDNPSPEKIYELELDKDILEKILSKISTDAREIIFLHDIQNMTFDEIGKLTNRPLNTVKSSYRRAMIYLRDYAKSTKLEM